MTAVFMGILALSLSGGLLIAVVLLLRVLLHRAPKWIICAMWAVVAFRLCCPYTVESEFSLVPMGIANFSVEEIAVHYNGGTGQDGSNLTENKIPEGYGTGGSWKQETDGLAGNGMEEGYDADGSWKQNGNGLTRNKMEDGYDAGSSWKQVENGLTGNKMPDDYDAEAGTFGGDNAGHNRKYMGSAATEKWMNSMKVLAVIWFAGMAGMLCYAALSTLRVKRQVAEAMSFRDNVWICDRISSPFIFGIFRPRIYLPAGMEAESAEMVLCHERAHLRRLDHWWKPLGFLLLAVYWFQPLCWVAYGMFCRDIELACDEKVVGRMNAAEVKAYAETLLSCSVFEAGHGRVSACPLAFGEVGVKERVKSVLNYRKPSFWGIGIPLAVCVIAAVCFVTSPGEKTEGGFDGVSGQSNPLEQGEENGTADGAFADDGRRADGTFADDGRKTDGAFADDGRRADGAFADDERKTDELPGGGTDSEMASVQGEEDRKDREDDGAQSSMLLTDDEIFRIVVINGSNGAQKETSKLMSDMTMRDILNLYHRLDIDGKSSRNDRSGYGYAVHFYDADGKHLQCVVPYEDGVAIDELFYEDEKDSAAWLLTYLESLFGEGQEDFETRYKERLLEEIHAYIGSGKFEGVTSAELQSLGDFSYIEVVMEKESVKDRRLLDAIAFLGRGLYVTVTTKAVPNSGKPENMPYRQEMQAQVIEL